MNFNSRARETLRDRTRDRAEEELYSDEICGGGNAGMSPSGGCGGNGKSLGGGGKMKALFDLRVFNKF